MIRPAAAQTGPSVKGTLFGAACLSLQPLLLNALSVPAMAYIIHKMGPDRYAQWAVAVSLIAVCAVLTNLGLRAAFVRAVAADPAAAGSALAEQLGLRLLLATLAGALVLLACRALGYPPVILWCAALGAAGLILTTVATTLSDLLQSVHRIKTLAAVNLASGLAVTVASVLVAWRNAGPIPIAAAYLTGPAAAAVLLWTIVRRSVCPVGLRWDLPRFGRLLAASRHFAAQQLLFAGSAQAEGLLSPRLIGMNQFGFFTTGAMLANRLVALPDALCTAAYPAMVRACEGGAASGARIVARYFAIAALGGVAVAIAGTLVAEPVGRFLLPGEPGLFAWVARVTIWSIPLIGMELVMGYGLNAAGRDAIQARLAVPAAAAGLLGSVALVSAFGLDGACWSMLFRPAVRAAILAPVAMRTFGRGRAAAGRGVMAVETIGPSGLRKAG